MKKIFILLCGLLLAACGGGTQSDPTRAPELLASSVTQVGTSSLMIVLGERRAYDFSATSDGIAGKSKVPSLPDFHSTGLEIRLPDISLNFDVDGPSGKLYRLYQAAFGRTPDVAGFGYWKNALEKNGSSLADVANAFLGSNESKMIYGSASDDNAFVGHLYQNVLGRAADSAGADYWSTALTTGTKRADVLLAFADSTENKTATSVKAKTGMAFAELGIAYIPVSNATAPSDVPIGVPTELDGSLSTDANGDSLNYAWSVTNRPVGSLAAFITSIVPKPKITFDLPGTYELTLWVSDATAKSFSPAQLVVIAHPIVPDSGSYMCLTIDAKQANQLYSGGHTYLDRNKDGVPCNDADLAYEKAPPIPILADTGRYKCADISHAEAVLLYLQGNTYLDRDHDGKPCEETDITIEHTLYPPVPTTPSTGGMCWVNGYTRKNGTYVSGYWRHC